MDIKETLVQLNSYLNEDLNFSSLKLSEKIIEKEPTEYRKFQYADTLRLCGKYSKSLQIFNEIDINNIPHQYRYLYHLYFGSLYRDIAQLELAKEQFRKCFLYEECNTVPYIFFSILLMKSGNNDEAIDFLEQALNKEGDLDEVYYTLAFNYAIKDNYEKALYCINKCLEIDQNYPNALIIKKDLTIAVQLPRSV